MAYQPGGGGTGADGGVAITAGAGSQSTGTVLFSNASGVSFGLNAGTLTASVVTTYQPAGAYLTTAMASNRGSDFVQANATIAGTSISGTIASNGFSLSVGPYLTTAAQSNHSHGNPQLNLTNLSGTTASASNGFTLSLAAGNYITTARASTDAVGLNTALTANGVSWTVNSIGISLNVPAFLTTARASTDAVGLNTALTANGVSWTVNSSGISLNVPAFLTTARASTDAIGLNTAQTNVTWTANSSGISFNAGGYAGTATSMTNASATLNTNGLALNVPFVTISELEPIVGSSVVTNSTLGQNTLYFAGFDVPTHLSAYRVNFFHSIATTLQASNSTNSAGMTFSACMYSRGTGTATDRINSMWSASWFINMNNSSNTQVRVTHPIGISNSTAVSTASNAVVSSSNASTYLLNSVGGYRVVPMPMSLTMTPGRYWMACAQSTTSSNAIGVLQLSVAQQINGNNIAYRPFGTSSAASNASFWPSYPGDGTYSATSGAFPATVVLTTNAILAAINQTYPYFNFSAYTTGTNVL